MELLKKYLVYGAGALLVYMPFHVFLSQWLSTFTGGLDIWKAWKDVFAALVTILCVVTVIWAKKYTKLFWWLLGIAAAYTAIHLLLILTTNQPFDTGILATVYNTRLFWFTLIGYSVALLQTSNFKLQTSKFVRPLLVVSTLVCLLGLLQLLLPQDVLTHFGYSLERGVKPFFYIDNKPDLVRLMSTIREPNSLGAFLILPSTISILALVRYWKTERRMLFAGLVLLHGLIITLTFSRSAWIGTFVAHALVICFAFRKHLLTYLKRWFVPIAVFCVMVLVGLFFLKDQYIVQNVLLHSDENTAAQLDSNEKHLSSLQEGLKKVAGQPFGHGPGTAGPVSLHSDKPVVPENYYIQLGYEVGIVGLLIFIAFLYVVISRLWTHRQDPLAQALIASFVGIALMNILLHTWSNEAVACSWFILAGMGLAPRIGYLGEETGRKYSVARSSK